MLSFTSHAATINKIDPPYWYAGLQHHELQLMVYGNDIGFSQVSTDYPGVEITNTVTLESRNYLLVYMDIKDAKPGKMTLTFKKDKQELKQEYVKMLNGLEQAKASGELYQIDVRSIITMSRKVIVNLAAQYENVKKGVDSVMGGQILEYEGKTIFREGEQKGRQEGLREGEQKGIQKGLQEGLQEGRKEGRLEGLQGRPDLLEPGCDLLNSE